MDKESVRGGLKKEGVLDDKDNQGVMDKEIVIDDESVMDKTRIMDKESVVGKTSIMDKESVMDKTSIMDKESVVDKTSTMDKESVVDKESVKTTASVLDTGSVMDEKSVIESEDIQGEKSVVDDEGVQKQDIAKDSNTSRQTPGPPLSQHPSVSEKSAKVYNPLQDRHTHKEPPGVVKDQSTTSLHSPENSFSAQSAPTGLKRKDFKFSVKKDIFLKSSTSKDSIGVCRPSQNNKMTSSPSASESNDNCPLPMNVTKDSLLEHAKQHTDFTKTSDISKDNTPPRTSIRRKPENKRNTSHNPRHKNIQNIFLNNKGDFNMSKFCKIASLFTKASPENQPSMQSTEDFTETDSVPLHDIPPPATQNKHNVTTKEDSHLEKNHPSASNGSTTYNKTSTPPSGQSLDKNINPAYINHQPEIRPGVENLKASPVYHQTSFDAIPPPTAVSSDNPWQLAPFFAGFFLGILVTVTLILVVNWTLKKLEERRKLKENKEEEEKEKAGVSHLQVELEELSSALNKLETHFGKLEFRILDNEKVIIHQDRRFNTMERNLLTITRRQIATDNLDMSDASRTEERRRVWFLQQQVEEMKREMKNAREGQEEREKAAEAKQKKFVTPEWEKFNDLRPRFNSSKISPFAVSATHDDRRGKWYEFTTT